MKKVTYATRGLEPMRGFPEFVEGIIPILEDRDDFEVFIAGQDRITYGGITPKEGSYWKWAKSKLEKYVESGKVKYLGHLDLLQYARLLKSSDVHVYLTRPFVASWSLIEAMASGCCIVSNKITAVEEIVEEDSTIWCDLEQISSISHAINSALNLKSLDKDKFSKSQRRYAEENWNSRDSIEKWKTLIDKCDSKKSVHHN